MDSLAKQSPFLNQDPDQQEWVESIEAVIGAEGLPRFPTH